MEDNGGGGFSANWSAMNLPTTTRRETSPPESSLGAWNSFNQRYGRSVVERPAHGGLLHSSGVATGSDRWSPYRSLEDEFSRLLSVRSSSQSVDDGGLALEPLHPNGTASDMSSINQDPYLNNASDLSWYSDRRRQPVQSGPPSMAFQRQNPSHYMYPYSNRSSPEFLADPRGSFGRSNSEVPSPGASYSTSSNSNSNSNSNSSALPELSYLAGNVVSLATDQRGARLLQSALEKCDSEAEIDIILNEVLENICGLTIDPFGNYVVQKLIELSNDRQRTNISFTLASDPYQLFSVCLDMHGTRVVQRLLELVDPRNFLQVGPIAYALTRFAVALTKSPNGHHVIQHCLKHFPDRENAMLLSEVAKHCIEVATDKSGCCVLQQCVNHAKGPIRELLVREIVMSSIHLSQDRYGNYVVQHILFMKIPTITVRLLRALEGSYTALSFSKYGSNVVEKCLRECDERQVSRIIAEMLAHPEVRMLFVDPFGNYVIQSALDVSKGHLRKTLIDTIIWNASIMRSNLYGKKVLDWLEKRRLYRP